MYQNPPAVTAGAPAAGRNSPASLRRYLLAALAVTAAALTAGCAGTAELPNPPRVSLAGLRLAQIGIVEQRYAAKFRVQNPNDARLRVRGMEYTIYINGRKFADGVSGRNFSVAGYGEKIIEVDLTSTVLRVYEQIRSLGQGEAETFRYRLEGSLRISGQMQSIPFTYEDMIDLSAGQES